MFPFDGQTLRGTSARSGPPVVSFVSATAAYGQAQRQASCRTARDRRVKSSKDRLWLLIGHRQKPHVRSPRTLAAFIATLIVMNMSMPGPSSAARVPVRSVIVSVADANCKVVEKPAPGEDGQDWAVLRCGKPAAGWQTYVDYGDARESLSVANAAGTRTALDLWSFNTGFSSVGPAVDYRVRSGVAIGLGCATATR